MNGIINFRLRHDDVLIAELAALLVGWSAQDDGMLASELSWALLAGYEQVRRFSLRNVARYLPS